MSKPLSRNSPGKSNELRAIEDLMSKPQSKQTYVSNNRQENSKIQTADPKPYSTNSNYLMKEGSSKNFELLPPRGGPFQRTKSRQNSIRDKTLSTCLDPNREENVRRETPEKKQSFSKIGQLKIKLSAQIAEKQKFKLLTIEKQQRISSLVSEIQKYKEQNRWLQNRMDQISRINDEKQRELLKNNQAIENLNKIINKNKINLSSMNSLKNMQNQYQLLKKKNQDLKHENQQLKNTINTLKKQRENQKAIVNANNRENKKQETIQSMQQELKQLKKELQINKTQRQKVLQKAINQLEKNLYQKQSDIRKISLHINTLSRKQAISIDDIRNRKDQEIRQIRQKFLKISREFKDLKQSRDKIQKQEKKNTRQNRLLKKVNSHKGLKATSESQQFTFELSSQT